MIELFYVLATWRMTNFLYGKESGPWHLIEKVRLLLCQNGMIQEMLECPLCISIWISGFFLPFYARRKGLAKRHLLAIWLGNSGLVCLIYIFLEIGHKVVGKRGKEDE